MSEKLIYGAGGGGSKSGGGGNRSKQKAPKQYTPTYTSDSPGLRSNSFAQLQLLICEGEIEGPAGGNTIDGLERSVYLDDTPIRVGNVVTPKPDDLVISYGLPAGDQPGQQTGVPGFSQVNTPTGVDKEVRFNLPVSQSISVSDPGAFYRARVLLTFQALQRNTNKGDVLGDTVNVSISYTDANNVTRTPYASTAVSGKFSGQFQREFEFDIEGEGPWRITVSRLTQDDSARDNASNTYRSAFNFSTVVLSLDQRLTYPYSSILSLGIRADQYSNLPAVSIDLKGLKIDVPSNYDPVARTYTGTWDGTFKRAYSNNPAWILRDLIVNNRYGLGSYIKPENVDKWTLYVIARYCDEQVPADVEGNTEPRFTCNLILQTSEQAWEVLQQLSSIFRGLLYYAAGSIVAVQDRPKEYVFTFSESNTVEQFTEDGIVSEGNFKYSGSAQRARHTVALTSWDDPRDNYQPRVEYIADEEGLQRFGYRPIDLRLMGVTSRGQALRAARWALLSESLLTDTVTFQANEIGSAVRPGDLIKIADPGKAARRYGGRIKAVNGNTITLDGTPQIPAGGWSGSTFSYMIANGTTGEPELVKRDIVSLSGDTAVLASTTAAPPTATFPWLIESPDRTAQPYRVLSVEEQEGGVFAFTALQYREDLYDNVDFDTPLADNEDYLFRVVTPGTPTIQTCRVIWDNNSAKLDVEWRPSDTNAVLNGFDLSVREYRFLYQAGSLQDDGSILWDDSWREIERQFDNREQIPIAQYVATDRFKVKIAAVSRFGAESEFVEAVAQPVEQWFPMPDLGGRDPDTGDPNATFGHLNQSSGAQLFSWALNNNIQIPPYVNGIALKAKPSRTLTPQEAAGLNPPDDDGYYFIHLGDTEDYFAVAFHALVNWEARINLSTAIEGLTGTTYVTDTVDRLELVPPVPQQFVVVTEPPKLSQALTRRFSWDFIEDPPFKNNWPLGFVNDIVSYDIRFKAGTTVDWERGLPLFSDGIPGDQQWFETDLFDAGQWVIMLKSKDRTGWVSDETQFVKVNLGEPLTSNVVVRLDLKDQGFPGELDNLERITRQDSGLIYPAPTSELFYQPPLDDEFYEGSGGANLIQIDPAEDSLYFYPFSVTENGVGLLVLTQSTGTYQWFLRKDGGDIVTLMYPEPLTDPIYPDPQSDYFYRTITADLEEEYHPIAAFEKLNAGQYTLAARLKSLDGTTKAEINDVDVILDYPDIMETFNDIVVPVGGTRVSFVNEYNKMKAINLTLQDSPAPGVPQIVMLTGKDRNGFNLRCYDIDGNDVEGLVDALCVGY